MMHRPDSSVDFDTEFYDIDLNDVSDADFDLIFETLSKHKVARIQATTKDAYTTNSHIV